MVCLGGNFPMKNKTGFSFAAALLLLPPCVFAQESRQEQLDILRFGTPKQVSDLTESLAKNKDNSLDSQLAQHLTEEKSSVVQTAILDFFSKIESTAGQEAARQLLSNRIDYDPPAILAAIRYAGASKDAAAEALLMDVIENSANETQSRAAIAALGKAGQSQEAGNFLLEALESSLEESQTAKSENIIEAIGAMKYKPARGRLEEILAGESNEMSVRRRACTALGRLDDPAAVPALFKAYAIEDSFMPALAIEALGSYPETQEAKERLDDALRHDNINLRLAAIKSFGESKDSSKIEILIFKAEKDPEDSLKEQAVISLGKIGGKANDFLQKTFENEKAAFKTRLLALEALLKNAPSQITPSIKEFMAKEELKRFPSPLYMQVCSRIARAEGDFGEFYERFLNNPKIDIKVLGIVGIKKNKLSRYKGRLQEIAEQNPDSVFGRQAKRALEDM